MTNRKFKRCPVCEIVYDVKLGFNKNKSTFDGLSYKCKDCRTYDRTNEEARRKNNEYQKKYRIRRKKELGEKNAKKKK